VMSGAGQRPASGPVGDVDAFGQIEFSSVAT
jgi:hypothetical protein